ncbi:hypothetical protein BG003_009699 [Podila horticola]|nr:hypothetical protein BG003_009699 [Podila horticola]
MKDTVDSSSINQTLAALDNYVLLGKSGLRVSPLSLGTMTFGEQWGFGSSNDVSRKIFDRYYESGGNFFDTANVYTNGESEKFLGEYISSKRSQCVVATKYTIPTPHADGNYPRTNPNGGGNHRKNLVESLDASLKRMGTGYTDILYVHLWEYRTPVQEVMRALDDVVRSGKALYVAVSDTPSWVISSANMLADLRGWSPFIGLQTRYNLLNRSLESDLQPMCAEHGLGIVPWGVLSEGFLSGKHSKNSVVNSAESMRKGQVNSLFKDPRNWRILDEVKAIAQECGKTPAQVALNWTLQKPSVTSPLLGVRTLEQLEDNLGALEFTLSGEQMARLDQVSNPVAWPFPQEVAQNLNKFVGQGLAIEVPRQYRALRSLRTSKI